MKIYEPSPFCPKFTWLAKRTAAGEASRSSARGTLVRDFLA